MRQIPPKPRAALRPAIKSIECELREAAAARAPYDERQWVCELYITLLMERAAKEIEDLRSANHLTRLGLHQLLALATPPAQAGETQAKEPRP